MAHVAAPVPLDSSLQHAGEILLGAFRESSYVPPPFSSSPCVLLLQTPSALYNPPFFPPPPLCFRSETTLVMYPSVDENYTFTSFFDLRRTLLADTVPAGHPAERRLGCRLLVSLHDFFCACIMFILLSSMWPLPPLPTDLRLLGQVVFFSQSTTFRNACHVPPYPPFPLYPTLVFSQTPLVSKDFVPTVFF